MQQKTEDIKIKEVKTRHLRVGEEKEGRRNTAEMRNIPGWENSFKGKKERNRRIQREERTEIRRWDENKQLIKKGLGWRCREKAAAAFFFAVLLRNLWIICCRGKTFCLPPFKKQA